MTKKRDYLEKMIFELNEQIERCRLTLALPGISNIERESFVSYFQGGITEPELKIIHEELDTIKKKTIRCECKQIL